MRQRRRKLVNLTGRAWLRADTLRWSRGTLSICGDDAGWRRLGNGEESGVQELAQNEMTHAGSGNYRGNGDKFRGNYRRN